MKLAIEGHSTQGSEVIARLEMLGGINAFNLNGSETNYYYYIDVNNKIYRCLGINPQNYIAYTLEEFLEKFPYKVGDKVLYHQTYAVINKMKWNGEEIEYVVECKKELWETTIFYLEPYKEETNMKENTKLNLSAIDYNNGLVGYKIPDGYEFDTVDNGKIILKPIKPQYPKTYIECAKFLECFGAAHIDGYKCELLEKLQELLICRDAYWKIAGAEIGLDKPWEPDWKDYSDKYFICYIKDELWISNTIDCNRVLAFPTKEMRDAFYENFKDLIEQCKELL